MTRRCVKLIAIIVIAGSRLAIALPLSPRQPLPQPPLVIPEGFEHRLTVKFIDSAQVRLIEGEGLVSLGGDDLGGVLTLAADSGATFQAMFEGFDDELLELQQRAEANSGIAAADLAGTFYVILDDEAAQVAFGTALSEFAVVEYTYIEALGVEPPTDIGATTPLWNADYQDPNPGIDAAAAHAAGFTGFGIRVTDIEFAWNPNHEDLNDISLNLHPAVTIHPSAFQFEDHGTNIMGILTAMDNAYGVTGIAHNAEIHTVPHDIVGAGGVLVRQRPFAIVRACVGSRAGDVVLLEMQGWDGPQEIDPTSFNATIMCTQAGVIVVGAASNFSADLDDAAHAAYRQFGDSRAIIVGAGTSNVDHEKLGFSAFGDRVNVQAWGQDIFTLGEGDWCYAPACLCPIPTCPLNSDNEWYTDTFGGTSGASAMVAGATALLQEYADTTFNGFLTPVQMRDTLIWTGRPQGAATASEHIGPFINVKMAMDVLAGGVRVPLGPHIDTPLPAAPFGIASGDFNQDAKRDLALFTLSPDQKLRVYPGNGDRTFGAPLVLTPPAPPRAVETADFNADSRDDLALLLDSGEVVVYQGNGNGQFVMLGPFFSGPPSVVTRDVVAVDLNNDTLPDLVVMNDVPDMLVVLYNWGNDPITGDWVGFAPPVAIPTGSTVIVAAVTAVDLDRDGNMDLIVTDGNIPGSNEMTIIKNLGGGVFQPLNPITVGHNPVSIDTGDFNGDGWPDVVVANLFSHDISVLLNNGLGLLQARIDHAVTELPGRVYVTDIDMDNDDDIIVTSQGVTQQDATLTIFNNVLSGVVLRAHEYAASPSPTAILADRFDQDADSELVVANISANSFSMFQNLVAVPAGISNASAFSLTFPPGPSPLVPAWQYQLTTAGPFAGGGEYSAEYIPGTTDTGLSVEDVAAAFARHVNDITERAINAVVLPDAPGIVVLTNANELGAPPDLCVGQVGEPISCCLAPGITCEVATTITQIVLSGEDCNLNGMDDAIDLYIAGSSDANENGIPDECESPDCNLNGIPDQVELNLGLRFDCNENGQIDECDIADGTSPDLNDNGIPDECFPPNDFCENAFLIADDVFSQVFFSTINTTTDGPQSCNAIGSDTWFELNTTCDTELRFSTCNAADFDTVITVYEGCLCPPADAIACAGPSPECNGGSEAFLPAVAGTCYLIQLGGVDGATGSGELTVECASQPPPSPPFAVAVGSRYLSVTAAPGPDPVALSIGADTDGDGIPEIALYVQPDGTLLPDPVFLPGDAWGEVFVRGIEVIPAVTYSLLAESEAGVLSASVEVTTWLWGDVDNNGAANLSDVQIMVQGFQGNFSNAAPEAMDLDPCVPNGIINLADAFRGVLAFQGVPYSETGCVMPGDVE